VIIFLLKKNNSKTDKVEFFTLATFKQINDSYLYTAELYLDERRSYRSSYFKGREVRNCFYYNSNNNKTHWLFPSHNQIIINQHWIRESEINNNTTDEYGISAKKKDLVKHLLYKVDNRAPELEDRNKIPATHDIYISKADGTELTKVLKQLEFSYILYDKQNLIIFAEKDNQHVTYQIDLSTLKVLEETYLDTAL